MNKHYLELLQREGLPKVILDCASGKIGGQIYHFESPAKWYGFPPALIPIWSEEDGREYVGYWKHWFIDRPGSFVEFDVSPFFMSIEPQNKAREIARTPLQLFGDLVIQCINSRWEITANLRQFARKVGITDLAPYERVATKCGYNPIAFYVLPGFETDLPLDSVADVRHYTGTFPTGLFVDAASETGTALPTRGVRQVHSQNWWEWACTTEIALDDVLENWPNKIARPPWLAKGRKQKLFREYLQKGELGKAWLTLNSKGWAIRQVKVALAQLAEAVNDDGFSLLAKAWTTVAEDSVKGY